MENTILQYHGISDERDVTEVLNIQDRLDCSLSAAIKKFKMIDPFKSLEDANDYEKYSRRYY